MKLGAFGAHICFKYAQHIHQFHDYTPNVELSLPTFIPAPVQMFPQILNDASPTNSMSSAMVKQNELPLIIPQPPAYETESKNMEIDINNKLTENPCLIEIDLQLKNAPKSYGANYIHCEQRTEVWYQVRKKRVTRSRLPALLGFYGNSKLSECLDVVQNETPEGHVHDQKHSKGDRLRRGGACFL